MSEDQKVYFNDPIQMAEQNRHHAIHTAIAHLRDGGAHIDPHLRALHFEMALDVLIKSVQKCSHLDNRPLDADRVHTRYLAVLKLIYGEPVAESLPAASGEVA